MMATIPSRPLKAARRIIGLALVALLLGQWALLLHGIEHARLPDAVAEAVDAEPEASAPAWDHEAGSQACQAFDHLLAGQAPALEEPAFTPNPPVARTRVAVQASSIAPGPTVWAFLARGPPRA